MQDNHDDTQVCHDQRLEFSIDADFPGGNIIVERIDGDHVYLRQDLRDTAGDWFYWCFRVRPSAGRVKQEMPDATRTLTFHFTGSDVCGVRGPACSADGGAEWHWLGDEVVRREAGRGPAFSYDFGPDATDVRFAFGIPYTGADLQSLLARHAGDARLTLDCLTRSPAGRIVELIRIAAPPIAGSAGPAHRVLFTCRHHCCEAMASFVLEGIIEALLRDDEISRWLLQNVSFALVPFVDRDGVEAGDQGKNRRPHDHNRDYGGQNSQASLYPEVRALREWVPLWLSGGAHRLAIDLHCPWIRGPRNEEIYFVGGREAAVWQRVGDFSQVLQSVRRGPLPYDPAFNLPFGQDWNTEDNAAPGEQSFAAWFSELPAVTFGTTVEIPYANAGGAAVTPHSARAFGADLVSALHYYLNATGSPPPPPD